MTVAYTIVLFGRTPDQVKFRLYVNGALANSGTNSILIMRSDEFDDFKRRLGATVK